jgi:hypothetical protein
MIAAGPYAGMRFPVAPLKRLPVEVLQRGKRTGGKEGFTDVTDNPFNPPLLIAGAYTARLRCEVVMGGQLCKPGMKTDVVTVTLQNGAF